VAGAMTGRFEATPPVQFGRMPKVIFGFVCVAVLSAIYVPIVVMGIVSLQGSQGGARFPLRNPGTFWYRGLFDTDVITQSPDYAGQPVFEYGENVTTSLTLALCTMIISTVFGFLAAHALRTGFKGTHVVTYLLVLGIVTPGVAVSLGIVNLAGELDLPVGPLTTGLAAHVAWTLPFSFIVFVIMFNRFDHRIEEAAYSLGASPAKAFWTITVPAMRPAVMSSLLFAFTLSMDEYAHSVFIMGAQQTLPLQLVATVQLRITPVLFALGSLIAVASIALALVYVVYLRRTLRRWERVGAATARAREQTA
jgi:putative spermidine/putrescine transport system permease protein